LSITPKKLPLEGGSSDTIKPEASLINREQTPSPILYLSVEWL